MISRRAKKALSILLSFVLVFTFGCSEADLNKQPEKVTISVVVKKQGPVFWEEVEMGARAAEKEFNISVNFDAPVNELDIDVQIELVEEAIKGADALVLAAGDYNELVPVAEKAKQAGMPVIIIDSALNSASMDSFVGTDNVDAGRKLGESLVEKVGQECRIVIMSFVKGTATANQRETGFREAVSTYPYIEVLDTLYCNSDEILAEQLTKQAMQTDSDIDAFVCLNAFGTVGVARAIEELGLSGQVKIIGFDSSPAEVNYLEKDVIQCLVIQNPLNMGYLGVKYAYDALNNEKVPENYNTGSTVIDRENMYLPENQKLLFPFVD